jgi:hypothetical protein
MKHFYLFLLLLISYQLSAQWSQVGANLGNVGSDTGVSLIFNPSTNEPYVAYADLTTGTFIIQKFDGTSWSQVGSDVGNAGSDAGVSLVFNPATNEPYVAYPDMTTGTFIIQKFNGTSWSQVGTDVGNAGSDSGVSLALYPTTNQPYVVYHNVTTGTFKLEKFSGTSWSQVGEDLGNDPGSGPGDSDPDVALVFNPATNQPYVAYSQESTNTFKLEKFDGLFWDLIGGTHLGFAGSDAGVSIAFNPSTNEPYFAFTEEFSAVSDFIKIQKFDGANWFDAGFGFGNVGSEAGVSLVFNPATNEPYVAYKDNNSGSIAIQKLIGTSWSQVGANLGNAGSDAGISLVFNPSTNEPYIAYPDNTAGSIIVQRFGPSLNVENLNNFVLNMHVFPNPTDSELNIELRDSFSIITVKTMNYIGKVISTQYFKNTNIIKAKIDQASGLYFIEVSTDTGYSKIIKIIKK